MNIDFSNALESLREEAEMFIDTLNIVSDNIRQIEEMLHEFKVKVPFYFHVHQEDIILSWELCEAEKAFRIVYEKLGNQKKKFCECSIAIRIQNNKYLIPFMNAFKQFIQEEKNQIMYSAEFDQIEDIDGK